MEETLQITQIIINIIIMLLFIGLVILVFGLIKQAKKINEKIDGFSKDLSDIKPKISDSIDKINSLTENVNKIAINVNDKVDVLGTVVDNVKDTAESILAFERKIQSTIEPPVMETLNTVTAVSVGVKTFIDSWKKNKTISIKMNRNMKKESELDVKLENIENSMEEVNKELDEVNSRLTDLQK